MSEQAVKADKKPESNKQLGTRLSRLVREVRERRRTWEQAKLKNHAAWHARSIGREQYASDTFHHYIPVVRRAAERWVTRATQMLMPGGKYFDVFPGNEYDLQAGRSADSVRVFHQYVLEKRVKIRKLINTLARTLFLYEQAIVKTGIEVVDSPFEMGGYAGTVREVWPMMRVVDPFNFYVWPETVTNMEEAQVVFEDVMMPFQEYEQHVRHGTAQRLSRNDLGKPEWPHHQQQRLSQMGFPEPDAEGNSGAPKTGGNDQGEPFVALTEVYFKVGDAWGMAWLVWNALPQQVQGEVRIVRLHKSSYPFPPYRMGNSRPLPSELYTTSLMDDLEPLQILYNDQVNQTEEARSIVAVPPVIIDPALVSRADSIRFGPRQRWYGNPEGFHVPQIPDVSMSGLRSQNQTLALINSIGGAGPMTEGAPTRGLPRAGFAVTSLISLSMSEVKDGAEIIEQDVLAPALGDMHRWTLAFVPHGQIIRIPGSQDFPQPQMFTINDLAGDWHFQWVGTLQAQDREARAQKLMAAIQQMGKVEPLLNMQGFMINWPALIKLAWRDGLGERGVEHIVVPMTPQMQQMHMLQQLAQALPKAGAGQGRTGRPQQAPAGPQDAFAAVNAAMGGGG